MKLPRRAFLHLAVGAAALPTVSRIAWAQTYPARPVRIVVAFPAGSSPDIRTRIVAEQLTKVWNRQVVAENRPGGGGVIGTQAVLSAAPDGYTLLTAAASTFTILPVQSKELPFDVNRDLVPIGLMANEGMVLAVSPKLGINTLAELIGRANSEPLHCGHLARHLRGGNGQIGSANRRIANCATSRAIASNAPPARTRVAASD